MGEIETHLTDLRKYPTELRRSLNLMSVSRTRGLGPGICFVVNPKSDFSQFASAVYHCNIFAYTVYERNEMPRIDR